MLVKAHTLLKWRDRGGKLFLRAAKVTAVKVMYAYWNPKKQVFEQEMGKGAWLKLLPVSKSLQSTWRESYKQGRFADIEWEWKKAGNIPDGEDEGAGEVGQVYDLGKLSRHGRQHAPPPWHLRDDGVSGGGGGGEGGEGGGGGGAGGGTIEEWLRGISLQQYTGAIKEYGYDSLEALDAALEADLEEMAADPAVGIKKPHRRLLIVEWKKRFNGSV